MKFVLDTHSHSLVSGHSYSTIREMALVAKEKGLELLGITEHSITMPGTCNRFYFENLGAVERDKYAVELMLGVELNIMDYNGEVDLENEVLKRMDLVIASLHTPCIKSGTIEQNTAALTKVMDNPYVQIIGHPDDSRYPVDYRELVKAAKEHHVILELNNSSLSPLSVRKSPKENDRKMLRYCMEYQVPIVVGSDAHVDTRVGSHEYAEELLLEEQFPEELVLNRSVAELKNYLKERRLLGNA